jgi:anti-sigma B factor antagonist
VPACRGYPVSVGPGRDGPLVVEVRKDVSSSGSLICLRGELDVATAPPLQRRLDTVIHRGARQLVVDLANLSFCDLAGVRVLLSADRELRTRGGRLTLLGPCGCVSRISTVFDLTSQLPIQTGADGAGAGQDGAGAGQDGAGSQR